MIRPFFPAVLFSILLFPGAPAPAAESAPRPVMRISVENAAGHVQSRFVKRFADALAEAAGDRLDVRFHPNAQLYRGANVIYALRQGRVEMGVPGTWHVSRAVPDVGVFLLPAFYGRPAELTHRLLAGPAGRTLNARIERALNVRVAGTWFDLGHAHLFGVGRAIRRHEDIAGLRIRVPGGPANALRVETLGGRSASIPWPDLPAWLDRGAVDGLLTTCATVVSARLWENGVSSAFLDREYFPQYVPLIARPFWNRLSGELRDTVVRLWEEQAGPQCAAAAADQENALRTLAGHGVETTRPGPEVLGRWRERLLPVQDRMVTELGIDPAFFRGVIAEMDRP